MFEEKTKQKEDRDHRFLPTYARLKKRINFLSV